MFNLDGYEMIFKTRSCCAHGGLITYIHNELECTTLTDIDTITTSCEFLCVELCDRKPRSDGVIRHLVKSLFRSSDVFFLL